MTRMRAVIVTFAVVFASIAADEARTADKMKLAVGQCGNWDSSQIELGTRIGAYARYGVELEALCTQGTGETQQAVIAGSGYRHRCGHARRDRSVRQGCAHPHRRRQRHRQCRFLDREGGVPAQKHQGCEPRPYHRLFEQRIIDSVSRRPSMQVTKP